MARGQVAHLGPAGNVRSPGETCVRRPQSVDALHWRTGTPKAVPPMASAERPRTTWIRGKTGALPRCNIDHSPLGEAPGVALVTLGSSTRHLPPAPCRT